MSSNLALGSCRWSVNSVSNVIKPCTGVLSLVCEQCKLRDEALFVAGCWLVKRGGSFRGGWVETWRGAGTSAELWGPGLSWCGCKSPCIQ